MFNNFSQRYGAMNDRGNRVFSSVRGLVVAADRLALLYLKRSVTKTVTKPEPSGHGSPHRSAFATPVRAAR